MCARCEELEEEVAYYKSELGSNIAADDVEAIRLAMRSGGHFARVCAAKLVLVLYRARGRTVTKWQCLEAIPPKAGGEDERDAKLVDVWVWQARHCLGAELIENVWGRGYRISAIGADLVGRLLGEIAAIPESAEMQDRSPEELRSMAALIAGLLAHKDGDGGVLTATTYRRIADRLTGQPRVAA